MAWLNKTLIRLRILDLVPSDRDPPSERRKCLIQRSTSTVRTSRISKSAQRGPYPSIEEVAIDDSCSVRMPDGSVGELSVDVMIDKVGNQNALLPLTVAIPVDVRPQPAHRCSSRLFGRKLLDRSNDCSPAYSPTGYVVLTPEKFPTCRTTLALNSANI